jgi:hypothetical protein
MSSTPYLPYRLHIKASLDILYPLL